MEMYGNNGSGKSTILNIIAHKLNLKGKELGDPRSVYGVGACYYFGDGVKQDCLGRKLNLNNIKIHMKDI